MLVILSQSIIIRLGHFKTPFHISDILHIVNCHTKHFSRNKSTCCKNNFEKKREIKKQFNIFTRYPSYQNSDYSLELQEKWVIYGVQFVFCSVHFQDHE